MATYPMSQGDLYLMLPLVWQHYAVHQAAFGRYKKARYTDTLGTEAVGRLEKAMKMPNDQARGALPEASRVELLQQTTEFLDVWNLLDGYIEEAFKASGTYKPMREAAGAKFYAAAAGNDWGAAQELVNMALTFVEANEEVLKTRGDMDADFVITLRAEGEDVRRVVRRYLTEQDGSEGATNAKVRANEACFAEFQTMSADAQRIFRRQPEVSRLFQAQSLLATVRGTRQAGVRGIVTDADGQEMVGLAVTVKGIDKAAAVTDADGRYFIPLASGVYTLVVDGRQEVAGVEVEVGVKRRVDVVVTGA